jgi:phosphatidylglycerophosphatase A
MIRLPAWIAGCFGIGYIKGGGTIAAFVTCAIWWWLQRGGSFIACTVAVTVVILVIGVWSATLAERVWGKDSSRIVIDEVAGMCIGLLFVPVTVKWMLSGLLLFRFFDIVKPLYIRKAEALRGGWGVMADDVAAGIYTNLVLQLIIYVS